MLKQLTDYLRSALGPLPTQTTEDALQLATAVLLSEVMLADAEVTAAERMTIHLALRRQFHLSDAAVSRLLEISQSTARDAYDFQRFTSLLNKELDLEKKVRIIEFMWQVALADEAISAHENHLLRKIAALLYIPHGDYIAAKQRARDALQPQPTPPQQPD